MSTNRAGLRVHENILGHLEAAVSLASSHFQHLVGNDFQQARENERFRAIPAKLDRLPVPSV